MDKIAADDWDKTFSRLEYSVVQNGPRYSETVVHAEEPGLASLQSVIMSLPGMMVRTVNFGVNDNLQLCDRQDHEYVESAFVLSGHADSLFNGRPVVTKGNMHAFQYSPYIDGSHTIISRSFEALHISFDLEFFKTLLQSAGHRRLDQVLNCMERKENYLAPPTEMPLQARMNELIWSIRHCKFNGLTRALFIEARVMELFALQVDALCSTNPDKAPWSNEDKEKLFAVKAFIEVNYLQPLSLRQLCMGFGLNEFKLKKGFKHLFHTTVFGYIQDLRMQKAMTLLQQKNMSISAIADVVGYANSGSFSAEFKKTFGYSPNKVIY
jgi:AraC family transcriptional regulator, transcriptional activator of the genes for pyochelin and ferripyochelin receptors